MKRIAIILNGDTEDRHLANVKRALAVQQHEGFEVYIASTENPGVPADHYVEGTTKNVRELLAGLKEKLSAEDEIEVYTTGHGNKGKKISTLCLKDACDDESIVALIDALPYAQRTIVSDQCYSGNWGRRFVNDPKTLFVAAGSKSETVCCQEMSPKFYAPAPQVPDLNDDGVVSRQERYAYAVGKGLPSSTPMFIPTDGYVELGKPPFENAVIEFKEAEELTEQLKRLMPGHYAIITFGATWCPYCRSYKPEFEKMAAMAGGQHLFLRTMNENVAADYGVKMSYPTVMIVNHEGKRYIVENRERALYEILQIGLSQGPADILMRRLALAEEREDDETKAAALKTIAEDWYEKDLGPQRKVVLDRLIAVARTIQEPRERDRALHAIALGIAYRGDRKYLNLGLRLVRDVTDAGYRAEPLRQFADEANHLGRRRLAKTLVRQATDAHASITDCDKLLEMAETAKNCGETNLSLAMSNRALDYVNAADAYLKRTLLTMVVSGLVDTHTPRSEAVLRRVEAEGNALEDIGEQIDVQCAIAGYYQQRGRRAEALAKYNQVTTRVRQLPIQNGQRARQLAEVARSMNIYGLKTEGTALFEESLAQMPSDSDALVSELHYLLMILERRELKSLGKIAALRLADAAEKIAIKNGFQDRSWFLSCAGRTLKHLGFRDEARSVLRRAIAPTVAIPGETRARWLGYLIEDLVDLGMRDDTVPLLNLILQKP